jgi:arylsulfate sulfotransferase
MRLHLIGLAFSTLAFAGMDVQMTPSDPSPSPVGTFVTWTAQAADSDGGSFWYRFRVREAGQTEFRMMRDFGPSREWIWAPMDHESQFEIEVTARNLATGSIAQYVEPFEISAAAGEAQAVITTTPHPLVFVYSAPVCPVGSTMRVAFTGGSSTQYTPAKDCDGVYTMNFYIAGLRAESDYTARHQVLTATRITSEGDAIAFTTGSLPPNVAKYAVTAGSPGNGVLVRSPLNAAIAATDLDGNVIWYYQYLLSFLTRAEKGGTFWGFYQDMDALVPLPAEQVLRKVDLAGIALLETNAARVAEQLIARGERPITGFHHEVISMPDGGVLVLGATAENGAQFGYKDGVVVGDKIVVLDRDLNVVWTWDAFEHLDPVRNAPPLGETCLLAGCPIEYANTKSLDWMHSNSVQLTPDGNLLLSVRHLDLLLKIDYAKRTGAILWTLGKGGHFQITAPGVEWPWFSHQHDAHFIDNKTIILFDNGNTRVDSMPGNSRGQLFEIDEDKLTAKLVKNFDLGSYSLALGSAQPLSNGNYHFNVGFQPPFRGFSVEVGPAGALIYRVDSSSPEYRSIRMADMYSGPQ